MQRQQRCVGLKWWGSVSDAGVLHVAGNGLGEKGGSSDQSCDLIQRGIKDSPSHALLPLDLSLTLVMTDIDLAGPLAPVVKIGADLRSVFVFLKRQSQPHKSSTN